MRNEDGMTPQERELEMALGGLSPAPTAIDRDRVMFSAGRASARRRQHIWQGISATLAILLVVSVASSHAFREEPTQPETVAGAPASEVPANVASLPTNPVDREAAKAFRQYVQTRRAVLERGIEVLQPPASPSRPAADPPLTRDDLEELLSST